MNKKEPGSYFTVMNITGNVKGKLVNTCRQPSIKAHLWKRVAKYLGTILLKKCVPAFFCPRIQLFPKGRFSAAPCLGSWKEGVNWEQLPTLTSSWSLSYPFSSPATLPRDSHVQGSSPVYHGHDVDQRWRVQLPTLLSCCLGFQDFVHFV